MSDKTRSLLSLLANGAAARVHLRGGKLREIAMERIAGETGVKAAVIRHPEAP